MNRVRSLRIGVVLSLIAGLLLFAVPRSQAAGPFTDNFTGLLAELQLRAAVLSTSTNKIEKSQWKACTKAITALKKDSTSLVTDLKTAGAVAKILTKAFPSEFTATTKLDVRSLTFTNDLSILMDQVFTYFNGDVTAALKALADVVKALPDGTVKTNAMALITLSQQQIIDAAASGDYTSLVTDLGTALKDIAKGVKLTTPKSSGGNGFALTAKIDGLAWSADNGGGGGQFTQSTGEFVVSGNRSSNPNSALSVYVISGVTGVGTYTTGVLGTYTVYPINYYITSGVVTITTLDIANHKASGTFSFSATDGATVTVTGTTGTFNITDLTVKP